MYLDQTLERTIKRFEDEYPESRPKHSASNGSLNSQNSKEAPISDAVSRLTSAEDNREPQATAEADPFSLKLSRTSSNTSLAARALTQEEGRMHRFGQNMRREILKPHGTNDVLHGTSTDDGPESEPLAALRKKLENLDGEHIRSHVEEKGVDNVMKELGVDLQQLQLLQEQDPEGFAKLKDAQMAAQVNAGMLDADELKKQRAANTVNAPNGATSA